MSVNAVKLFRPQDGDIVIVDFNKVNVTQVENALVDLKVPVIAVHDIETIKIYGMREQKDFTQENADLQLELEDATKEINRLNRIIKDDMVPKSQAVPQPQAVGNLAPRAVPVTNPTVTNPIVATTSSLPSISTENK